MIKQTHTVVDIAIVCSDFAKSLEFYRDQLGFEIAVELEISAELATQVGLAPSGFRQVRLQAGDTLLKLMQIESPPASGSGDFSAGVRWITFFVADLKDTVAQLQGRGVEFVSDPFMYENGGVVCARDPDGLLIELVQRQ